MEKIVDMIIRAYVETMGADKWNGLSGEEQREIIMTIVKDASKALDGLEG